MLPAAPSSALTTFLFPLHFVFWAWLHPEAPDLFSAAPTALSVPECRALSGLDFASVVVGLVYPKPLKHFPVNNEAVLLPYPFCVHWIIAFHFPQEPFLQPSAWINYLTKSKNLKRTFPLHLQLG